MTFGSIDIRFNVVNGLIKDTKIFGDFFGTEDVALLEEKLNGVRYDKVEVSKAVENEPIQKYFGNISKEEL